MGEQQDVLLLLRPPGVYRAQDDTALLTDVIRSGGRATGRHVLDIGTGTGALAVAASRAGAASVTAVDLSLRSVAATRINSWLQRAPVSVHRGDLFEPVRGRRFDLIVANPPYVPAETEVLPRHRSGRCWDAGRDGRAVLDRICAGAADMLTPDGMLLLVHSAVCDEQRTVEELAGSGMAAEVVRRAGVPFGPVMRARAAMLESRGLVGAGESVEQLVVIEAHRAR